MFTHTHRMSKVIEQLTVEVKVLQGKLEKFYAEEMRDKEKEAKEKKLNELLDQIKSDDNGKKE